MSSPSLSGPLPIVHAAVPAVGPDGTVYIVYMYLSDASTPGSLGKIRFAKYIPGSNSYIAPTTIADNIKGLWGDRIGWLNISSYPTIAVDPSSGYIYVAYTEYNNGDYDIKYVRYNGSSWSSPKIATQSTSNAQVLPWLTVNSSGVVSLTYYQGNSNGYVDVYMAQSYNNGDSFSGTDTRITPSSQDPTLGDGTFDYTGVISTANGKTLPCWTDFSAGATARVSTTPYYYSGGNVTQSITIPLGKGAVFSGDLKQILQAVNSF